MSPDEIAQRAEHLRLSKRHLSGLTGINEHTIGRTLNAKTEPYQKTVNALIQAIVTEEVRVLRHLAALHPDLVTLKRQRREAAE